MSLADWGRFAASEPLAAGELIRSVGDYLSATGKRLVMKADDVQFMARTRSQRRRALRLRRRAEQRLNLAASAYAHAEDLFHRAAGHDDLCRADPLRPPLSLET